MKKPLSCVSEVVLLLRELPKNSTVNLDVLSEKLPGCERNQLSAALYWMEHHGYLTFKDVGAKGMYQYTLVEKPTDYPLRHAPAFATRNRTSGTQHTRRHVKQGQQAPKKAGRKNAKGSPRVHIKRELQVIETEIERQFQSIARLSDRYTSLMKKLKAKGVV